MTTRTNSWFSVDKEGLAEQLERRGRYFAVLELLQNALDEPGVTEVEITLTPVERRAVARLVVRDNAPAGYADLSHSYTFFAPSTKRANPEQRGRFNSGEKLVLAICEWAKVTTTSGCVLFGADGERGRSNRETTDVGSIFEAQIRMTRTQIEEAEEVIKTCVIPRDITVTFNGEKIAHREPVRTFTASLDTEVDFRPTRRKTTVSLYEPIPGRAPHLYEMGIPVVEHDGKYDIDIAQRIPLNSDRDNVTPSYLRRIRQEVLEHTVELLDTDDTNSVWVKDALPKVSPEVAREVFVKRFGEKTAVFDPSDMEANKRLQDEGYTLIYGRTLSRDEHEALRRAEVFKPAGAVRPSGVGFSRDGKPPIPVEEWTPAMSELARYTNALAEELLGFPVTVEYLSLPISEKRWAAAWCDRCVRFNLGVLGRKWVESPDQEKVDALLLHEFAHAKVDDHFTDQYIDAVCALGAKMRHVSVRLGAPT